MALNAVPIKRNYYHAAQKERKKESSLRRGQRRSTKLGTAQQVSFTLRKRDFSGLFLPPFFSPIDLIAPRRQVAAYHALPRVHHDQASARGFVDSPLHGSAHPPAARTFQRPREQASGGRTESMAARHLRRSTHLRAKVPPDAELTMRARASWTRHGERNIPPKHYCSRGCATDSRCRTRPNEPHNCAITPDRRKHMYDKQRRKEGRDLVRGG